MSNVLCCVVFVFTILFVTSKTSAADFQRGIDAYNAKDYAGAFKEWKPLADAGDARGQFKLAGLYWRGKGVEKNSEEAIRLLQLSANQKYAFSMALLGTFYRDGDGVPYDSRKCYSLIKGAAEQVHFMALTTLGNLYADGKCVERDAVQALKWWKVVVRLWDGEERRVAESNIENLERTMSIGKRAKAEAAAFEWMSSRGLLASD